MQIIFKIQVSWKLFYIYICNQVYCTHVQGHDPLILSFSGPFSFLIGWEFYGPNYPRC